MHKIWRHSSCSGKSVARVNTALVKLTMIALNSCICGVICLLVFLASLLEYFSDDHSSPKHLIAKSTSSCSDLELTVNSGKSHLLKQQLLLAFSLRSNLKKVFDTRRESSGGQHETIQIFHGIKFFGMVWIIALHSMTFSQQWINFSEYSRCEPHFA